MILRKSSNIDPAIFLVTGNISLLLFFVLSRWLLRGGDDFIHGAVTGALLGTAALCFYVFARRRFRRP